MFQNPCKGQRVSYTKSIWHRPERN